MNQVTIFIKLCLNIFLVEHPIRLAIGVCIGIFINGIIVYLSLVFSDNIYFVSLKDLPISLSISIGLIFVFFPYLRKMKNSGQLYPERHQNIFNMIDEAHNRGALSKLQLRNAYNIYIMKNINQGSSVHSSYKSDDALIADLTLEAKESIGE